MTSSKSPQVAHFVRWRRAKARPFSLIVRLIYTMHRLARFILALALIIIVVASI